MNRLHALVKVGCLHWPFSHQLIWLKFESKHNMQCQRLKNLTCLSQKISRWSVAQYWIGKKYCQVSLFTLIKLDYASPKEKPAVFRLIFSKRRLLCGKGLDGERIWGRLLQAPFAVHSVLQPESDREGWSDDREVLGLESVSWAQGKALRNAIKRFLL